VAATAPSDHEVDIVPVRRDRSEPGTRRRRPGELEGDVLAALWASPEAMPPADVQAAVGGDLAYTTVMTILVRLHGKGLIERTKRGRAFAYRPVVAETEVVAEQVRRLLAHGNDRVAVLQGLIDGLRPEDETILRAMLAGMDGES
jgi:predicted transcriptional regulator